MRMIFKEIRVVTVNREREPHIGKRKKVKCGELVFSTKLCCTWYQVQYPHKPCFLHYRWNQWPASSDPKTKIMNFPAVWYYWTESSMIIHKTKQKCCPSAPNPCVEGKFTATLITKEVGPQQINNSTQDTLAIHLQNSFLFLPSFKATSNVD